MKIMRPVAERRKRIEAALAAVSDSQDVGEAGVDAKGEPNLEDAKGEPMDDSGDAKSGAVDEMDGQADDKGAASDMDDVKSPSKEDGAVADVGDAKEGAIADSKGEPLGDDAKGGARMTSPMRSELLFLASIFLECS